MMELVKFRNGNKKNLKNSETKKKASMKGSLLKAFRNHKSGKLFDAIRRRSQQSALKDFCEAIFFYNFAV